LAKLSEIIVKVSDAVANRSQLNVSVSLTYCVFTDTHVDISNHIRLQELVHSLSTTVINESPDQLGIVQ
jgi:hypothetical protein